MDNYNPNNSYGNNNGNYNNYNANYNNSNYNGYNANNSNYNGYNTNYNNNSNYNNNYNSYNTNYSNNSYNANYSNTNYNQYQNGYNGQSYPNYGMGFEQEKPIVLKMNQVKSLFAHEVIAKSFLFMFVALLITAFAAFTTDVKTAVYLLTGDMFYLLLVGEIAIVLVSNYAISKNNAILATILYVVYAYLTGITMSVIFLAYTTASITAIFLITAAVFAIMAVYGLITDTDLSSVGNLCLMGLIGIVISGFVNLVFLGSDMADTIICSIGVLVFVGLTAYDTQKIKERVNSSTNETAMTLALFGGFELYLDFVNLFLKLLRLFGKRK